LSDRAGDGRSDINGTTSDFCGRADLRNLTLSLPNPDGICWRIFGFLRICDVVWLIRVSRVPLWLAFFCLRFAIS
jgi:hypothetical protein